MLKLKEKIKLSPQVKMVLYEIAVFVLGFALTPIKFAFGLYPFGLALVGACRRYTPFAFCGAILSVVFLMDVKIEYIVALIAMLGLRIIASFIKRKESPTHHILGEERAGGVLSGLFCENIFLKVTISALVAFGIGLYYVIKNGYLYYDIFALVFFFVFEGILVYLMSGAFVENARSNEKSLAILAFAFVFAYGLSGKEIQGIDLAILFSYAVVLYTSRYISGTKAGVLGLVLGIAQAPIFAPIYGIGGVVSGFLWRLSPYLATMCAFCMSMGFAVYASGYDAIVYLAPELLAVCLIMYPLIRFELLPKPKLVKNQIAESKNASTVLAEGEAKRLRGRLSEASLSFEGVSHILKDVSKRIKAPDRGYFYRSALEIAEGHCYTCPKKEICWQGDAKATEANIKRLGEGAFTRGECDKSDIDQRFLHRCPNIEPIIDEVNLTARDIVRQGVKNDKLDICARDYRLMSRLLSLVTKEKPLVFDRASSDKIARALSKKGLVFEGAEVLGDRERHIIVTGIDTIRTSCSIEEIKETLEQELEIGIAQPTLEVNGGVGVLEAFSVPKYEIESYTLQASAKEGDVNGDSLSSFEGEGKRHYLLLCDGMGSGKEARLTSQMCAHFLEKILKVTSERELALSMLNNLVRAKNTECSSSVDLLEIDMLTLEASFTKSGACPSFVKRGGKAFRLSARTAPIGIMKELDAQRLAFGLEKGDVCVMLSDGILPVKSSDSWVVKLLESTDPQDIRSLPEKIIKEAKERNASRDDMSVLVALIK
ncbi:MAG: SpoIIE family protein phosphatase [Clostridia bacterium]|nr:SpoIIE family protein phosphatase [Clostridia bacterium]